MKKRAPIPFAFVFDQLDGLNPVIRPMFGCHAVYIGEKIMIILRSRENHTDDNGIWLSTKVEHHQTLKKIFPSLRSIKVLGKVETNWQLIPAEAGDFEEAALKLCELIQKGDARIGSIPTVKKKKRTN